MPDFSAIAALLGGVKGVFDFIAGTAGSLAGFESGPVTDFETLFGSLDGGS